MTGDNNKPGNKSNSDTQVNTALTTEASIASAENSQEQQRETQQRSKPAKEKSVKEKQTGTTINDKKSSNNNAFQKTDAEKKSEYNIKPATDSGSKTTSKTAHNNTQKLSKLTGLILVILLLLIGGLSIGTFYGLKFWKNHIVVQEQRFTKLEQSNSEQLTKIETISQRQKTKSADQENVLNAIKQEQDALQKQLNQRLDSHTERLRALAGTSRSDWLLAEARYLLRLAGQRLLVESSTVGAQALLQSADQILLSIDDPELLPIRSAIAQEAIALKLAKNVDRPGIFLQLSALKDQIQALPLIPFRPEAETINSAVALANTDSKNWYSTPLNSLKKAFKELESFIQIRQHNKAPELLISEQQQLQIINNLMLMLEQAQYSLLHEEELIYQESLKKAQQWWRSYYSHYSEYEGVNHEINKLLNKEITQTIPSINRSTKLLTDYIDRFHKINGDDSNTKDNILIKGEEKTL